MWNISSKFPYSNVTLANSPLSREGKTRCGSRQRPPRRGKRKSLLRPMLRRKPTTSNADALDAVPASAEGTPPPLDTFPLRRWQARGPPVDVGDLSREIDRQQKIRFVVELLLLARSLNWSSRVVCLRLAARAYHPQQTSATYARSSAGPRIHYLDAPQTQPSSARLQRQQAGRGRLKPGARQTV